MKANKAIATPEYIGDIMNGRRDTIPLRAQPDPALPLALWVDGNDEPTCHLQITECWDDGEGWTVTVREWTYQQPPRLLRSGSPLTGGGKARLMSNRKIRFRTVRAKAPDGDHFTEDQARGYTDRPELSDKDCAEEIEDHIQQQYTLAAIARDARRKRAQSLAAQRDRELLSHLARIELAKTAARDNYIDIHTDLLLLHRTQREYAQGKRSQTAVTRRLEDLERRAHQDAA